MHIRSQRQRRKRPLFFRIFMASDTIQHLGTIPSALRFQPTIRPRPTCAVRSNRTQKPTDIFLIFIPTIWCRRLWITHYSRQSITVCERVFFLFSKQRASYMQRMPTRWIYRATTASIARTSATTPTTGHEITYLENMVGSCVPPILALCQLNADMP